jgi:hypothetical protein
MISELMSFSCAACGITLTVPRSMAGVSGPCPVAPASSPRLPAVLRTAMQAGPPRHVFHQHCFRRIRTTTRTDHGPSLRAFRRDRPWLAHLKNPTSSAASACGSFSS